MLNQLPIKEKKKTLKKNILLQGLLPHASKKISDSIRGNPEYVDLTVGIPNFGLPSSMIPIISQQISLADGSVQEYDKYADSLGHFSFRRSISQYYHEKYSIMVNPKNQILVSNGAAGGIWASIYSMSNYGDEVIIPDPSYMLYESIVKCLGRKPVRVPVSKEENFQLSPKRIENAITDKTAIIIINSPANPTGTVLSRNTLQEISDIAKKHSVYLIHDEVFGEFAYREKHVPTLMLEPQAEHIIMVNSFSKHFGMTGWRLGWVIGHQNVISDIARVHTFMCLSVNSLAQLVAAKMLNNKELSSLVHDRKQKLMTKIESFITSLRKIEKFSSIPSTIDGGYYLFFDVKEIVSTLPSTYKSEKKTIGEIFTKYLFEQAKIAVVPGCVFGSSCHNYIRMSIGGEKKELDRALERLHRLFST